MARITVRNSSLGTTARINMPADGVLSYWQVRRVFRKLGVPPGYPGAGALGEEGPQRPPERPDWEYIFERQPDGSVRATPHPVAKEPAPADGAAVAAGAI